MNMGKGNIDFSKDQSKIVQSLGVMDRMKLIKLSNPKNWILDMCQPCRLKGIEFMNQGQHHLILEQIQGCDTCSKNEKILRTISALEKLTNKINGVKS